VLYDAVSNPVNINAISLKYNGGGSFSWSNSTGIVAVYSNNGGLICSGANNCSGSTAGVVSAYAKENSGEDSSPTVTIGG